MKNKICEFESDIFFLHIIQISTIVVIQRHTVYSITRWEPNDQIIYTLSTNQMKRNVFMQSIRELNENILVSSFMSRTMHNSRTSDENVTNAFKYMI
jgi:hypothetical protein